VPGSQPASRDQDSGITEVFQDLNALSLFDPDHSENEDRWITLGLSEKASLLVVIHTFLEKKDGTVIIRIISSRKATKQEVLTYGE
jgi:uncharacterized protein